VCHKGIVGVLVVLLMVMMLAVQWQHGLPCTANSCGMRRLSAGICAADLLLIWPAVLSNLYL
jgi:hypothetical protein